MEQPGEIVRFSLISVICIICYIQIDRHRMKLLKTSDINIVRTCQHMFGFELPSVLLDRRTRKFVKKNEKFMS